MPPKKNLSRGPLVIGVTPTRTRTPIAVKQYVDPHPMGGVDIIKSCETLKKCQTLKNLSHVIFGHFIYLIIYSRNTDSTLLNDIKNYLVKRGHLSK